MRNDNIELKETIRELQKEKLVLHNQTRMDVMNENWTGKQSQSFEQYDENENQLIEHFQNVDINQVDRQYAPTGSPPGTLKNPVQIQDNTEESKDKRISDLQYKNGELAKIIDQMAVDI